MKPSSAGRFWALIGVAAIVTLACAPARRYEALSFFFDGVPAPPGVTPRPGKELVGYKRDVNPSTPLIPRARPPAPKTVAVVSIHPPVREHKCGECHDARGNLDVIASGAQLCDKCHKEQRVKNRWDHGPINLGTCVPCHVAHESIHPHLLAKPVPDVCSTCHALDEINLQDYHQVDNFSACTACHDPHKMSARKEARPVAPSGT